MVIRHGVDDLPAERNAFGGYDYAKLMRKVQFIEAYNIGGSQAVVRSFPYRYLFFSVCQRPWRMGPTV